MAGVCGPESANSPDVLKKKQEWYVSNWQKWKAAYYAAETRVDTKKANARTNAVPIKETGQREAIRNQYIDARLDLANEYFRKFVISACECQVRLSTAGKNLCDSSETKFAMNQLIAARAEIISRIKGGVKQNAESYSLIEAEQDLSDLELSLSLPAATNVDWKTMCKASEATAQPAVPAAPAASTQKAIAAPGR